MKNMANDEDEATEIVREDIREGRRKEPDGCEDSWFEVDEYSNWVL